LLEAQLAKKGALGMDGEEFGLLVILACRVVIEAKAKTN
jgi:hypothetical protein